MSSIKNIFAWIPTHTVFANIVIGNKQLYINYVYVCKKVLYKFFK